MVFGEFQDGQFEGMSVKEIRTHKLECRLREFDIEVENRLEQMRVEIRLSTQKLNQVYRMGLMLMPKDIRAMPLATFREVYQGDMIKVQKEKVTEKLDSMDSMEMPPPPPPSTARRSSRKRKPLGNRTNTKAPATASKKAKQSSSKAAAAAAATATSSDRRSTRRSTRMSTAAASTGAGTTTSARATRRSTRMSTAAAAEVVEAAKQLESATFKTPMPPSQQARGRVPAATPALAAGLPQTPFLRQIKRGESLMSLNGSPVTMENKMTARMQRQSSIISVPLTGGKVVQLDGVAGIEAAKGNMSRRAKTETLNHLESLQAQIASMMSALQAQ